MLHIKYKGVKCRASCKHRCFTKKVDFKKNQQATKNIQNFPGGNELNTISIGLFHLITGCYRLTDRGIQWLVDAIAKLQNVSCQPIFIT